MLKTYGSIFYKRKLIFTLPRSISSFLVQLPYMQNFLLRLYGNSAIDNSKLKKDLGVKLDYDMTFEQHISDKVKKSNAIMGLSRRNFTFLDQSLFRKLYTTFVRPHLEYAQAVWAPHLAKHVNMVENVQK